MNYLKLIVGSLTMVTAAHSAQALAGEAVLGGMLGGAAGAAIGHHVGGRHGAIIGAGVGGATGVVIANGGSRERHYEPREVIRERTVVRDQPRYYHQESKHYAQPVYHREPVRYAEPIYYREPVHHVTPVYYARPQRIIYVMDTPRRHHPHGRHHGWNRHHDNHHDRPDWSHRDNRHDDYGHRPHDRRPAGRDRD